MHAHIHTHMHTCVYTHTHTHTNTDTHTHTHTHKHTHMCACVPHMFACVYEHTAWVPPPLGPRRGLVREFDLRTGNGLIVATDEGEGKGEFLFFNFTSIPGEGYRTIQPGALVAFECVEHKSGLVARNVQRLLAESG